MTHMAFDVHGTLDADPDILKPMLKILMEVGVKVTIISGPPVLNIIQELDTIGYKVGIHYNCVQSIVATLQANGAKMWQDENKEWWSDDETWWSSKALICKQYDIDVLIDNEKRYEPYLDPKVKFINWRENYGQ